MSKAQKKGDRNEREAKDILSRVYGSSNTDRVDRGMGHDPFGLADIIALKAGWPVRVVQVTTNRFPGERREKYRGRLRDFPHSHAEFEVWVRVDRDGWEFYRHDPVNDTFERFLKMGTCDTDETVEAYREAVGYYKREYGLIRRLFR